MLRKYLIVAWGTNKDTGKPYSKGILIREDTYNSVPQYAYTNEKDVNYFDKKYELGKVVECELMVND